MNRRLSVDDLQPMLDYAAQETYAWWEANYALHKDALVITASFPMANGLSKTVAQEITGIALARCDTAASAIRLVEVTIQLMMYALDEPLTA